MPEVTLLCDFNEYLSIDENLIWSPFVILWKWLAHVQMIGWLHLCLFIQFWVQSICSIRVIYLTHAEVYSLVITLMTLKFSYFDDQILMMLRLNSLGVYCKYAKNGTYNISFWRVQRSTDTPCCYFRWRIKHVYVNYFIFSDDWKYR